MFDSHAHVSDEAFDADRKEVISRILAGGVSGWMEVGTNIATSKQSIALAEEYPEIIASVGVHPHDDIHQLQECDWQDFSALADNPKVKAIGEVGLDFSRQYDAPLQAAVLRRFISVAQEKNLPVIFHVRSAAGKTLGVNGKTPRVEEADAHDQLISILRTYTDAERPKGVIHTFSGSATQAEEYISLGMHLSFSGVITFKKSGDLQDVAKKIPIERLLVETDCPYLTPEPFRGKRNDPSFMRYTLQKIADLRNMEFQEMAEVTHKNALNLFQA